VRRGNSLDTWTRRGTKQKGASEICVPHPKCFLLDHRCYTGCSKRLNGNVPTFDAGSKLSESELKTLSTSISSCYASPFIALPYIPLPVELPFIQTNIGNNIQEKVKVKVKFTLEQATKAQMGSRSIALLFL